MRRFWLVLLLLLWALPAGATDFYVSPSGTGDCSSGSPCAKTYALANAVAGDTVYFKPGTYNNGGTDMTPTNNGSCGGPLITFRAEPGAVKNDVILQNGYTGAPSATNPKAAGPAGTWMLSGKTGIQIGPGFTFSGDLWPPQVGGCAGGGCAPYQSYGCNVVVGNWFSPGNTNLLVNDVHNNNMVVGRIGDNSVVKDNIFDTMGSVYDTISGGAGYIISGNTVTIPATCPNGSTECPSGIEVNGTGGAEHAWVVNNTVVTTASGSPLDARAIWCDVGVYGAHYVNNYIKGRFAQGMKDEYACRFTTLQYNIFNGVDRVEFNGGDNATDYSWGETFDHNTLYGFGWYWYKGGYVSDLTWTNNAAYSTSGGFLTIGPYPQDVSKQVAGGSHFDYNLYCMATGCTSGQALVNIYSGTGSPGAPTQTLATWRTTISGELNSAIGNPSFTNVSTENFSLQAGSPALGTGQNLTNKGACPGNSRQGTGQSGNNYLCGTYDAVPTITVTPAAASIRAGEPVSVAWASPTGRSCTNSMNPSSGSYGAQIVFPSTTTQYTVDCENPQGTSQGTATVAVTPRTSTPSPTVWFKMDEASGNATDAIGGLTCTMTGSPGRVAHTNYGNALDLSGSGQYCTVTNTAALNPTSAITFSFWVKMDTLPSVVANLLDKRNASTPTPAAGDWDDQYYILISNDGAGRGQLRWIMDIGPEGATRIALYARTRFQTGTWYHVVASYDGAYAVLAINGIVEKVMPVTGAMTDNGINLRIGANQSGGNSLDGQIDDVRIYNVGLYGAEFSAIGTAQALPPATMTITSPTSSPSVSVASATFNFGGSGTAGTTVSWTCDVCGSGSGTGDASWTATATLQAGPNVITVQAADAAGQLKTDSIQVQYNPPMIPALPLLRLVR